jgi:hypothetical protein
MTSVPVVELIAGDARPEVHYAIDLLAGAIGVRLTTGSLGAAPAAPCLHYGGTLTGAHEACAYIRERSEDRLWTDLLSGQLRLESLGARLPFDVVAATLALVTDRDLATAGPGAADRHARAGLAATVHGASGLTARPIVNLYALALRASLEAAGLRGRGEAAWPRGRRAAIGLSHDVDRPDKYALLRAVPAGGPRLWVARPDLVARFGRDALAWLRDRNRDDFWLFEPVLRSEDELGMRSTLLFAAMPSQGAYGSRHDVHYDIGWPRFRKLLSALVGDGVEIGLHASYNAYQSADRLSSERARLSDLAGVDVRTLRHHYWHLGPQPGVTLRHHETAGFQFDSSLAFNDDVGFRRGIALPFHPWDPELGRPLRVLQLPVLAMDGALFRGTASSQEAADRLWAAIEGVRDVGGVAVLDWHVRTSFPGNRAFRTWGECYQTILRRLSAASDIWATDLGSIGEWWNARERRLRGDVDSADA